MEATRGQTLAAPCAVLELSADDFRNYEAGASRPSSAEMLENRAELSSLTVTAMTGDRLDLRRGQAEADLAACRRGLAGCFVGTKRKRAELTRCFSTFSRIELVLPETERGMRFGTYRVVTPMFCPSRCFLHGSVPSVSELSCLRIVRSLGLH